MTRTRHKPIKQGNIPLAVAPPPGDSLTEPPSTREEFARRYVADFEAIRQRNRERERARRRARST